MKLVTPFIYIISLSFSVESEEGQAIVIKYFSLLALSFLQQLNHTPERVYAKSVLNPNLEFLYVYFSHPWC
jgi:hypothetical protein